MLRLPAEHKTSYVFKVKTLIQIDASSCNFFFFYITLLMNEKREEKNLFFGLEKARHSNALGD